MKVPVSSRPIWPMTLVGKRLSVLLTRPKNVPNLWDGIARPPSSITPTTLTCWPPSGKTALNRWQTTLVALHPEVAIAHAERQTRVLTWHFRVTVISTTTNGTLTKALSQIRLSCQSIPSLPVTQVRISLFVYVLMVVYLHEAPYHHQHHHRGRIIELHYTYLDVLYIFSLLF